MISNNTVVMSVYNIDHHTLKAKGALRRRVRTISRMNEGVHVIHEHDTSVECSLAEPHKKCEFYEDGKIYRLHTKKRIKQ